MAVSVSQRLNILCCGVREWDSTFITAVLLTEYYVTDSILLTPEKYLYDPIIYLIGNVCVHKTSLTPSLKRRKRSKNMNIWDLP